MSTKNSKKNGNRSHRRTNSRRPSRHHQRRSHADDAKIPTTRRHWEMTNGHHHTESDGSRQQTHRAKANRHRPSSNRDSQTIPCGGRQATRRGHKMPPVSQTRRRPVENVVGSDS